LIPLTPWKDVAYSIALVTMVLMIFYLIGYEERMPGLGFWLIFGVVTSLVALFRLNGALVAFGSFLALMAFDHRRWKSYLPTLILGLSIFLFVTGPFYRMMNVNVNAEERGENLGPYYRVLSLVMTHDKASTFFSPEERTVLSQFVLHDGTYSTGVVARHKDDLLKMALSASLRNPSITLEFFLSKSRFIFQILQPPRERIEHVGLGIYPNPFGFTPDSKLPFLQPYFLKIDSLSESPVLDWLFWRNAFWMFLLIFSGTIACIRLKTWKYLVVILPVLLNAIPLLGAGGGQISRYIYATLLLGPLLGIGLFFIQPTRSTQDQPEKLELTEAA
jgi:4-amino-4-deoxy-L-arabinose transferase-like glycosyltransferase